MTRLNVTKLYEKLLNINGDLDFTNHFRRLCDECRLNLVAVIDCGNSFVAHLYQTGDKQATVVVSAKMPYMITFAGGNIKFHPFPPSARVTMIRDHITNTDLSFTQDGQVSGVVVPNINKVLDYFDKVYTKREV